MKAFSIKVDITKQTSVWIQFILSWERAEEFCRLCSIRNIRAFRYHNNGWRGRG